VRVIIRFSLNNDRGSALRNALAEVLEGGGLVRQSNTATYEGDLSEAEIRNAMRRFWNIASGFASAHVDHFWMYADAQPAANDDAEQEDVDAA
jgi:hypothetical protein